MKRVPRKVAAQLRDVGLFSDCTNRQLRRLASIGTPVSVAEGQEVTAAGAAGAECLVVLSGRASCRVGGRAVAAFGPGDFFGEVSLIDGGARSASVVAETPMELLDLDRREFGQLLEVSPSVVRKMLSTMAARLREADAMIGQLALGAARR